MSRDTSPPAAVLPGAEIENPRSGEAIAVVGIGCRYPGVAGPDDLWNMLVDGRCAVGDVPADRWNKDLVFDAETSIPRRGAFLDDVRSFDAQFFDIAPREAEQMDPQQRIMLEVSWEALENAGISAHALAGTRTGVYLGVIWHDYEHLHARSAARHTPHSAVGQALDLLSARVSYALGLQGPSMVVNTACSSSLVALHLACQALRTGECETAIVGGSNMMLSPEPMIGLTRFGGLAPDGVSKAFSAAANGFGRGEGVAAVVLKPLARAIAAGDRIYCAIRATGVNNDGGGRQLTSPSIDGQRGLLRYMYAGAGIDPASVQYVEAHGTGTPVGDPIEAQALGEVLGCAPGRDRPLLIGSIKTNIGHQEGGAGVAGVIKVALSMHHGRIPTSLHSQPPNPAIDFEKLNLRVLSQPARWDTAGGPPLAGVSSFGWGGTNAHVVMQGVDAPARPSRPAPRRRDRVLLLSAASPASLRRRAADIAALLEQRPDAFDAVCASLAARRAHLAQRLVLAGPTPAALAAELRQFAERGELTDPAGAPDHAGPPSPVGATGAAPAIGRKVVFVFPGQGSQWLAMGRALMQQEPVFAATVARCDEALREFVDWSLESVLTSADDSSWLDNVDIIQCSLWAMQVALAALWRSWGVEPHAVVGHSMGEVAAACVAGAIELRDGARIMSTRSRLAKRRSGAGGMLHVALSAEQAAEAVRGHDALVSVAVCSSPRSTVLSGDVAALQAIQQALTEQDVYCAPVRVDYASHSPQMDELLDELRAILSPVAPAACAVPMYSTSLARTVSGEELGADYWARNLRNPVRFAEVTQALALDGHEVFLEVSPHPILVPSIKENLETAGVDGSALGSLRRDEGGRDRMLASLAALHASGAAIRWDRSDLIPDSPVIDLPRYPWERDQHWLADEGPGLLARAGASHAFIQGALRVATHEQMAAVMVRLAVREAPFLQDHMVQDAIVFPAAGHIDLVLAAARETYPDRSWSIEDMQLAAALALASDESRAVQVVFEEKTPDLVHFSIASAIDGSEAGGWTTHVRGRLGAAHVDDRQPAPPDDRSPLELTPVDAYYDRLRDGGLMYGPCFRGIASLATGPGRAEGIVEAPAGLGAQLGMYCVHPALLDAALQLALAAAPSTEGGPTRVPVRVASARLYRPWPERVLVSARARGSAVDPDAHVLDVQVTDPDGAPVMHVGGVELGALAGQPERPDGIDALLIESVWHPAARSEAAPTAGTWGVIDLGGHGDDLVRALEDAGQTAHLAVHLPGGRCKATNRFWLGDFAQPGSAEEWLALIDRREPGLDAPPLRGVILLGVIDGDSRREPDWTLAETLVVVLSRLTQAMSVTEGAERPRLVLVSASAQSGQHSRPEWAALWGAGRVLDAEHPEVPCTRIDVDGAHCTADIVAEVLAADGENEVAYRRGERLVARLERGVWGHDRTIAARRQSRISARETPYRIELLAPGSLDALTTCAIGNGELAGDRIRVQVDYAGLNPSDLMKTSGQVTEAEGEPIALGLECSGRVAEIGADVVTELSVGDEVVVTPRHALQSYVDVAPVDVVRKPVGLSMAQAASYPCAYMTAWYALHHLARVEPGERILVHAGAELGHAAVEIARRAGLEIFASAGSAQERAYLRSLGVEHVFDASSASFAADLGQETSGQGVDVVFNAGGGEMVEASMSVLRFAGRFLEVGQRAAHSQAVLPLHLFQRAIAFFSIDLASMHIHRPALFRQLLEEVTAEVDQGRLPPFPLECFDGSAVRDAFERLARPQHVDKVVLDLRETVDVAARALPGGRARADGVYLISGGLGALGAAAGEWLAHRGARHIVLLGRTAGSLEGREAVERMRAAGVEVETVLCDVGSWSSLSSALLPVLAGRPVRGVLHAAGVLEDATIGNLTAEQVARVFRPKVHGAWNLHRLTEKMPVDFFVIYSSAASLFGSAGQAAYSAANACVDALAHHRLRRGLPASSINWGPVDDIGLAAKSEVRGSRLAARGLQGISVEEVTEALERTLDQGWPQVGVARLEAEGWKRSYPGLADLARWSVLLPSTGPARQLRAELRALIEAAMPDLRAQVLEGAVRRMLASVLRLAEDRIGRTVPFGKLGLDSLLGLELRNQLERALGAQLPATLLWRYPTLERLAPALLERAGLREAAGQPREIETAAPPPTRQGPPAQRPAHAALPGTLLAPDLFAEDVLAEDLVTSTGDDLVSEFEAELARSSTFLQGDLT